MQAMQVHIGFGPSRGWRWGRDATHHVGNNIAGMERGLQTGFQNMICNKSNKGLAVHKC